MDGRYVSQPLGGVQKWISPHASPPSPPDLHLYLPCSKEARLVITPNRGDSSLMAIMVPHPYSD